MTIALWVYTDHIGTYQTIICKQPSGVCSKIDDAVHSNHGGLFTLMLTDINKVYFSSQRTGDTFSYGFTSPVPIKQGFWTHIAVTVNKLNNLVNVYINGQIVASDNCPSEILTQNTDEPIRIGFRKDHRFYPAGFRGSLDDIKIYSRVLSDSEIKSIYNWD